MPVLPLTNDPRDLKADASNDIIVTNGDLVWSRGADAVTQDCRVVMQMFAEEWFLNLSAGIPYLQSIFGQKPAIAIAAATVYIRANLMAVSGVVAVTKLQINFSSRTRTMNISWQVQTGTGNTQPDSLTIGQGTSS